MKTSYTKGLISGLLITLFSSQTTAALVIGASPLANKAEAASIYEPLATLLSGALDIEVTYEHAQDWQQFTKSLFADHYDIIVAEPHIAAYVSDYDSVLGFNVLSRLPGRLSFHTIVAEDNQATSLKNLASSRICMLPSPNFSGVLLKKEFTNPVTQPMTIEVRGGFDKVYSKFSKGRCHAAMISDQQLQQLQAQGAAIKSIFHTKASPNQAIAVSQRVPPADRQMITEAIHSADSINTLQKLYSTLSGGESPFIPSNNDEYKSFNILPGVIWGW